MATERLGVVLSTATAAPPKEFVDLGKIAEDNGFEAILVNEGRGDALACAEAIALGTSTIKVGTNIANIYFRHPFLAAMSAWTIAELSDGRLILGLGISHRRMVESLGIQVNEPRAYLRSYVRAVKAGLAGESTEELFRPRRATHPVPVLTAALTAETARVGGEAGDGIMPFLPSRAYLTELVAEARAAASAAGRQPDELDCIISIPTFVSDDADRARSAARYNLAAFARLPNYRRQWRRSGFAEEVDAMQHAWKGRDRRAVAELVSDRMVEAVCVFGPAGQCREQLDAFREAGAGMPVLAVSPVDDERLDATRKALTALSPR
jgi:alkanesulfonate monooxygenase SsuD/methylene tetrahydromethanopterin reductase-like flavin-dependent oxidoreductase (luciferase family)